MILEGFEIQNFSCIKHLVVNDLPPTGVVILHGPNGTGKSSIIAALRACLMDYPSSSASAKLKRWFPKDRIEKPRVSVTFRAQGQSWRIVKQFGSRESTLECRTPGGAWRPIQSTASEAHEQTRTLTGGKDSDQGLHQLLWLTQSEFHLPEPREFDGDVQSQLRSVLGVLQTPQDDRFIGAVREAWSRWFDARSKRGESPRLKRECALAKDLAALDKARAELAAADAEFQDYERIGEHAGLLELQSRDLRRQLTESIHVRDQLQTEFEESLKSLQIHRQAAERLADAQRKLSGDQETQARRKETEDRLSRTRQQAAHAETNVHEAGAQLAVAEQNLRRLRREGQSLRQTSLEIQARRVEITNRKDALLAGEQAFAARERLTQAERTQRTLDELRSQAQQYQLPDSATVTTLVANRHRADAARAELNAASIALTLSLDAAAVEPVLKVDGAGPVHSDRPTPAPRELSIRRRAEIGIPGWGRITVTRGDDVRSVDQIEAELQCLEHAFTQAIASTGIPADHPAPLDRLRELVALTALRAPEIARLTSTLIQLAPKGLEALRQQAALADNPRSATLATTGASELPATAEELTKLADELQRNLDTNQQLDEDVERQINELEREINGGDPQTGNSRPGVQTLRQKEAAAKDTFITLKTSASAVQSELERMLTTEQIDAEIREAEQQVAAARATLESVKLSENEETVGARLESAKAHGKGIEARLRQMDAEFHSISGQLRTTAGLHQKRAAAALRVDQLERVTERGQMESAAYDRLSVLFDECREKQLGTVMKPIHDRVLRWMRLVRIGGYHSIRFNDQFLPEMLEARSGALELPFSDESLGTVEQLALMVRLALGTSLSTPDEPVTAVLDDPLTHSDLARMGRMHAVLSSAASGEPPAGPLQILVFTCHPEQFAIEMATEIDLGNPAVLVRHHFAM